MLRSFLAWRDGTRAELTEAAVEQEMEVAVAEGVAVRRPGRPPRGRRPRPPGDHRREDREDPGVEGRRRGGNNQLGVSFVLGARAWDEQSKIRLRVGPLSFDQFLAFLPDGPAARPLGQLARLFVDAPLAIEIVPVLKASEIPPPQLSPSGPGVRLGRHAWLAAKPLPRDADDLAYPAPT